METQASHKSLQCVVVTPERAVLDEAVDFVALPMYDGELGVLPGRLPLIGRLGFGELRTVKDRVTKCYFIDGGFAQVRADVVTVLGREAKKRRESATAYDDAQRPELAAREREELEVLAGYLPAQLSDDELSAMVAAAVAESGADSPRAMGAVIKLLTPRFAGRGC